MRRYCKPICSSQSRRKSRVNWHRLGKRAWYEGSQEIAFFIDRQLKIKYIISFSTLLHFMVCMLTTSLGTFKLFECSKLNTTQKISSLGYWSFSNQSQPGFASNNSILQYYEWQAQMSCMSYSLISMSLHFFYSGFCPADMKTT